MPDTYRLIHEMSYADASGTEHTYPVGSVRDDIPPDDIGWLVEQRHIELASELPDAPSAPPDLAPSPAAAVLTDAVPPAAPEV